MRLLRLLAACCAVSLLSASGFAQLRTPSEHLGRPLGADFTLADWEEVSSYYAHLAAESPRVQLREVGTTTEGRTFLIAVFSSEANLARLEELREFNHVLSDPRRADQETRRRALDEGRVFLCISNGMHSTETAPPQFGMEFAWQLATSEEEPYRSAREEMVVLMTPCTNPDGLDTVVDWYRENVGKPTEGTGLTRLYQHYTGHDNNRDWFALTQAETRIMTEQLYSVWRPQVYWDVHQQGSSRERLFVPPFRDPLNPNLDPAIISSISAIGTRAVLDMTREGFSGISTGVSYDMWWNGGNRNVPVRHNMIGLLTEAASVNLASPIWFSPSSLRPPRGLNSYAPSHRFPWPWPGGWWRIRDIIDYKLAFGRSLLNSLSSDRASWLAGALDVAERTARVDAGEAPIAWLVPSDEPDPGAARRLAEILLLSGVELKVATSEVVADGRSYPEGSILILRDQPYSRHVKDLFEVQRYPEGEPPYDVAGWTLPMLFGVRRIEVIAELAGSFDVVESPEGAVSAFAGRAVGDRLDARASDTWLAVHRALAAGESARFATLGEAAGTFALGGSAQEGELEVDSMPRIGLYAPWSGSMDEGWMRWVFDTWELPYTRVRNEMVRAGRLHEFLDVLVLPSISGGQLDDGRAPGTVAERYTRGLDPEGAVAVEEFVRAGGVVIATGSSASWIVELLELPLESATRGEQADGFSCPGSVVRSIPESHLLTTGLPASLPVFFSRSTAWEIDEDARKEQFRGAAEDEAPGLDVLLRFAPTRFLLSGYAARPEVVAGKPAWVRAEHGDGVVHVFGFRPQYRGWSQAAFPLLFRAILLESREPAR